MKHRTNIASALLAVILIALTALSFGSCGKNDAIQETREILTVTENFTFTYMIEGRDSTQKIAVPYRLSVTADACSEESPIGTAYAVFSGSEVTVWEPSMDTFVPLNRYARTEYDAMTRGEDSTYGIFLSFLDKDAWKWDRSRDVFVPKDFAMFRSLELEVTDMELAITDTTCTLMGSAVKTIGTERYEMLITMAVTDIGGTTIELPAGIDIY